MVIIRWAATRKETIGIPAWIGVSIRTLHARTVCRALGCSEGYRPGGHDGPHVSWVPLLMALQTDFVHCPLTQNRTNCQKENNYWWPLFNSSDISPFCFRRSLITGCSHSYLLLVISVIRLFLSSMSFNK